VDVRPDLQCDQLGLFRLGLIEGRINWLGDPNLALISVMIVNVWRGVPFYAISLLAGLQTISRELHEAAAIDGARGLATVPACDVAAALAGDPGDRPVLGDPDLRRFQLVYVLTGGGPANATQLFATYAYQLGIGTGLLSEGATICARLFFPVLLLVVIVQLCSIRRVETH